MVLWSGKENNMGEELQLPLFNVTQILAKHWQVWSTRIGEVCGGILGHFVYVYVLICAGIEVANDDKYVFLMLPGSSHLTKYLLASLVSFVIVLYYGIRV